MAILVETASNFSDIPLWRLSVFDMSVRVSMWLATV